MPNFFKMNEIVSNRPAYTAIVLDPKSRSALLNLAPPEKEWSKIAHHCTINMGPASKGPAADLIGRKASLTATHIAIDDKVVAAKVETMVPSVNTIKHVTIAVNRGRGGKPHMSNNLINWMPIDPIPLVGVIAECDVNGNIINDL
jgi:hypothetical protein